MVTFCDHLAGLKFSKTLPYAFTEHGAVMAIVLAIRDLMDSPRGKVRKIGFGREK